MEQIILNPLQCLLVHSRDPDADVSEVVDCQKHHLGWRAFARQCVAVMQGLVRRQDSNVWYPEIVRLLVTQRVWQVKFEFEFLWKPLRSEVDTYKHLLSPNHYVNGAQQLIRLWQLA